MRKIIITLFIVWLLGGLFLSLKYSIADDKITIDIEPWQKLVQLHQSYYLGNKTPSQNSSLRLTDAGLKGIDHGEIIWQYLDNVSNPLQKITLTKDNDKFIIALINIEKWCDKQSKKLEPISAQINICQSRLEALETVFKDSVKSSIPDKTDLFKLLTSTPDEISYLLRELIDKSSDKKKANVYIAELKSILERLRDIDNWVNLEIKWMKENIKTGGDYIKRHPDLSVRHRFGLLGIPTVASLIWFHKDWLEFQRQVEDILCLASSEVTILGQSYLNHALYLVAPKDQKFYAAIEQRLKDHPRILETLRKSLESPYNLTYLNCLLDRYNGQKVDDYLIEVMKNWEHVNPALETGHATGRSAVADKANQSQDMISLLEVLNYRQGCPLTSEKAIDRFEPHLLDYLHKFEAPDRDKAHLYAAEVTHAWYSEMKYDKNRPSVADVFKDKKADCCNVTNICTYLLANAGYGNNYGVNEEGTHWVSAFMGNDGRIRLRDCLGDPCECLIETFPENYSQRGPGSHAIRWVRTVASGIESELVIDGELIRREIPYYNQKAEVVKISDKK